MIPKVLAQTLFLAMTEAPGVIGRVKQKVSVQNRILAIGALGMIGRVKQSLQIEHGKKE